MKKEVEGIFFFFEGRILLVEMEVVILLSGILFEIIFGYFVIVVILVVEKLVAPVIEGDGGVTASIEERGRRLDDGRWSSTTSLGGKRDPEVSEALLAPLDLGVAQVGCRLLVDLLRRPSRPYELLLGRRLGGSQPLLDSAAPLQLLGGQLALRLRRHGLSSSRSRSRWP
jgi:hypothetical protein